MPLQNMLSDLNMSGLKRKEVQNDVTHAIKKQRDCGVQEKGHANGLTQAEVVSDLGQSGERSVAIQLRTLGNTGPGVKWKKTQNHPPVKKWTEYGVQETGHGGGLNIAVAVSDTGTDGAAVHNDHGYARRIAIRYQTLGETMAAAARDDEEDLPAK